MNKEPLMEWLENMINQRLDPIAESLNRSLAYDHRNSAWKGYKAEGYETNNIDSSESPINNYNRYMHKVNKL